MAVASNGTPSGAATLKTATSSGNLDGGTGFSPVGGRGYVVVTSLQTNGSGAAGSTIAWLSGGSGSWSKLASFVFNIFQPVIEVWFVHASSSPGTSRVSCTGNGFTTSCYATITEITGHNSTQSGGASTNSATTPFNTLAITPNNTGGLIFYGAHDNNEGFTVTPNGSSTALDSWNNGGQESYSLISSGNTTASTPITLGVTNTLTGNIQLALEINAAVSTARRARPALVVPSQAVIRAATW